MRKYLFIIPVASFSLNAWPAAGPHCSVSLNGSSNLATSRPPDRLVLPAPVLPAANASETTRLTKDAVADLVQTTGRKGELASSINPADQDHLSAHPPAVQPQGQGFASASKTYGVGQMSHKLRPITAVAVRTVPALQRISGGGATLYDLGTQHGMRAVFARNGKHFQVFYITPDGKAEIGGVMWNAAGQDLTLAQVKAIPGVIPTVTIGDPKMGRSARQIVYRAASVSRQPAPPLPISGAVAPFPATAARHNSLPPYLLQALAHTTHGSTGRVGAPRLWMLIDPQCTFSIQAMHRIMPYVNAGKVRVSVIPLSVLDYDDQGASTVKAKVMVSQPPDAMVADWIDQGLPEQALSGAGSRLAGNMELARAIHLRGTPTFLWRNAKGRISYSSGIPASIGGMIASIGH
jgi:thiol:disulfide interchange protein DsbG